jgi:membrane protease YdiL (CAAX protease family)
MGLGVATAYGVVGALAAAVAVALGQDPFTTDSWVGLAGAPAMGWSALLGVVLGVATVLATRVMVRHARWARVLHAELRPAVRDADDTALVLMALASGIGEELFFRGLLVPLVGVVVASLGFGLLHQVRGPARWAWAAWAAVMGLLFALTFRITGSLVGPIVAHVVINGANLRFLRDTDPEIMHAIEARAEKPIDERRRGLGGLLGRT